MTKRVVVTGVGLVTPVGTTLEAFLCAIYSGNAGIRRIKTFDVSRSKTTVGGTIENFNPRPLLTEKELFRLDRTAQLAIVAADAALRDARLADNGKIEGGDDLGLILGTGAGGIHFAERTYC